MNRPGFGDWGSALDNDEFAMALAILGMIGAAGGRLIAGDPAEIAERLLRTLESQAGPIACRYLVGRGEYLQPMGYAYTNVSQGRLSAHTLFNAYRELRPALERQPRFEVTVEDFSASTRSRQSGGWILDQLRRPELNAASVYLSTLQKVRTVDWQWPIRIGTLDQKAATSHAAAAWDQSAARNLTVLVDMAIERGAVDLLLITDTVQNALATIEDSPYPLHAHTVVVIDEGTADLDWLGAEAAQARMAALTQAEAVLFTTHHEPAEWLNALVRDLSHSLSFDVAVARAGGELRPVTDGPLLWCSRALIRDSLVSNFVDVLMERGVDDIPSDRTLLFTDDTARRLGLPEGPLAAEVVLAQLRDRVRQIGFHSESDGATLTSNVNRALLRARSGKSMQNEVVSRSSGQFTPTFPAPRHLQVSVMARERSGPATMFVAETMHNVDVHIGPPSDDELFLEEVFPEPASPPSGRGGHLLTVVFFEPQLMRKPQLQTLLLPASGASLSCRFAMFVGSEVTGIEARITILHENRVLQTGVLRGPVAGTTSREADQGEPKRIEFVVPLVVQRAESDLDCRGRFDGALVLNHLGERPGMLGTAGNRADYLWLDDVTVQASKGEIERALDTGDWDFCEYDGLHATGTTKLLRTLALTGNRIHAFLIDQLPAPIRSAKRLQVVMAKAGARFPLEFLYERNPPARDAPVCPHAADALRSGACSALCDTLTRVPAPFVCPLGFWGLNRVLEWHAFSPELSRQLQGASARLDMDAVVPSDEVPLDGSCLFGYSKEIDKADAACIPNFKWRTSTMPNPPVTIDSWPQWKAAVRQRDPGLLMLLVHTKIDADGTALEMGPPSAIASEQDTLLRTDYITEEYVRHGIAGTPIMLLLGCTTGKANLPFDSVASAFKYRGHAGIIVASSNLIYGPKAVEIAETFLQALSHVKNGERFGDVMLEVRRTVLANGMAMVLCLSSYGDADWKLTRH